MKSPLKSMKLPNKDKRGEEKEREFVKEVTGDGLIR